MNKTEYKKPIWLWIVIISYAIIMMGGYGIIITIIGFLCGNKCASIAKKNKNFAFLVGYLFNLVGLVFYEIYFYYSKNKQNIILVEA